MCHIVLMMPLFGLGLFAVLPLPAALSAYMVVLGTSILLYRAIHRAHRHPPTGGPEALRGCRAQVRWDRGSYLIVGMRGEYWTADLVDERGIYQGASTRPRLESGRTVEVIGSRGVRLQVAALDQ